MENVCTSLDAVIATTTITATTSRRSRLDDIVTRHRQRRIVALTELLVATAICVALMLV
jgi:hypothetical protein